MSVKIPDQSDDVQRTDQFKKFQTLAISAQAIPVLRDLKCRLQAIERQAYDEGSELDLEHLAFILDEASEELDALAEIAQSAD
jgi:hypothetical protein